MDNLISGEPWLCCNHHVLGLSKRLEMQNNGRKWKMSVLFKLRESLDVDTDMMVELSVPEADVDCQIEGTTKDIKCSVCGERRTWWIGKQSLHRLLAKMGVQQ